MFQVSAKQATQASIVVNDMYSFLVHGRAFGEIFPKTDTENDVRNMKLLTIKTVKTSSRCIYQKYLVQASIVNINNIIN